MSDTKTATANVKTWGDLKRLVESLGVTDDDHIAYIDFTGNSIVVEATIDQTRHGYRKLYVDGS